MREGVKGLVESKVRGRDKHPVYLPVEILQILLFSSDK